MKVTTNSLEEILRNRIVLKGDNRKKYIRQNI